MSGAQKKTSNPKEEKPVGKTSIIGWACAALVLFTVFVCLVVISPPRGKAEPPKISFSETFWDFGRTPQDSYVSHIFWIKNTGGDTLRILKVKPG